MLLCLIWGGCQFLAAPKATAPAAVPWPSFLATKTLPSDSLWVRISKPAYTLEVYWGDSVLVSYGVVFGTNPVDDKLRQGDRCTPEGRFRIREKYPHPRWRYFLWLDYPTADSWRKHRAAKAAGLIPAGAQIGGEIGLHGVPAGYDHAIPYRQNWTLGCVSLQNQAIAELYAHLPMGTLVQIEGVGDGP